VQKHIIERRAKYKWLGVGSVEVVADGLVHGQEEARSATCLLGRDRGGGSAEEHIGGSSHPISGANTGIPATMDIHLSDIKPTVHTHHRSAIRLTRLGRT